MEPTQENAAPDRSILDRIKAAVPHGEASAAPAETPVDAQPAQPTINASTADPTRDIAPAPDSPEFLWKGDDCVNCGGKLDEGVCSTCGYDRGLMVESQYKN